MTRTTEKTTRMTEKMRRMTEKMMRTTEKMMRMTERKRPGSLIAGDNVFTTTVFMEIQTNLTTTSSYNDESWDVRASDREGAKGRQEEWD